MTDRIVAVKLLPPQLIRDEMFVKRFRREAHAAARLNNPHVIPIHTYGEIEGRLYVDMQLIEGRDTEHVLARGPMDVELAVRVTEQVATALNAAHSDSQKNNVLKLVAGQSSPTEVTANLNFPTGLAVDTAGTVYIADGTGVLKLSAGVVSPTKLGGVSQPRGVAVDGDGNVYVTDTSGNQVLKFEGSDPKPVGFTELNSPLGVAVDGGRNV